MCETGGHWYPGQAGASFLAGRTCQGTAAKGGLAGSGGLGRQAGKRPRCREGQARNTLSNASVPWIRGKPGVAGTVYGGGGSPLLRDSLLVQEQPCPTWLIF